MSEPIPESIPTSADPRSRRPIKRARTGANTAAAALHANEIDYLMQEPERPIALPEASSANKKSLAPPPEIVANVQGSSAGAGSGEFHVYKASRRREYERLRTMDEEAKQEEDDAKWAEEQRLKKEKDEENARKNREKRNKKKGKKGGGDTQSNGKDGEAAGKTKSIGGAKKPLEIPRRNHDDNNGSATDFSVGQVLQENGITIHDDD